MFTSLVFVLSFGASRDSKGGEEAVEGKHEEVNECNGTCVQATAG